MGDIFREIDEELRQDRYEKLWRQYGKYLIAAAVCFVLAVAGYQGWRQYEQSERDAESAKFAAAVAALAEGKSADAQALFTSLGRETTSGYGTLARLHEAALRVKAGDRAGAIQVYDRLAADDDVDKPLRELATILGALHRLNDAKADVPAIRERVKPLAAKDSPWRFSALEILAVLARQEGKSAEAKQFFRQIVDDPDAPRRVRTRASRLLTFIEG